MVDTAIKASKRAKRPNYPTDFKKRLAKAACAPDVSVSQLALEHVTCSP
jgi:transposase-like protein